MNSIEKSQTKKMNNIILLWYFIYFIILNVPCLSGIHAFTTDGYHNNDNENFLAGPLATLDQQNDINLEHHLRHHHKNHHKNQQYHQHQEHQQPPPHSDQKARDMWAIITDGNSIDQANEQKREQHDHHLIPRKPKSKENCLKCQDSQAMSEAELKELRIEYVKNQILKKLRLTERPNVSASNIPREVLEGATLNTNNAEEIEQRPPPDFFAKATQKILFPLFGEFYLNVHIHFSFTSISIKMRQTFHI